MARRMHRRAGRVYKIAHEEASVPVTIMKRTLILAATVLFSVFAVWGQAPQKNWKDRAEYDLYEAASKATDNAKKIELLNTWKQKYPNSDFNMERLQMLLEAYQAAGQIDRLMETGNEILSADPKNLRAMYIMAVNTVRLVKPTPELLGMAEKAVRGLLNNFNEFFGPDKRPASTPEADWKKAANDTAALAHLSLGWIHMQRKQNEEAEKEFTASLQANPANAQVSYWLGTVMLAQKNPDKTSAAMYHFFRAGYYSGQGALPDQTRKEIAAYINKLYTNFHGSDEGAAEIRKMAQESVFPPADFKIASKAELDLQKEEEFRKANPMLALWKSVKGELTGPEGASYFENHVKGALLPGGAGGVRKFRAKLVAAKPPKNPKELVLSLEDPAGDITLQILEEPLPGSAPEGTELEFEGVPVAFRASPYMLTFEVEKDQISGWPTPSPAKKAPAAKKAAPAKK